jgi:hypothetical protein
VPEKQRSLVCDQHSIRLANPERRLLNHRFRATTVREWSASFFQEPLEREVLAALARGLYEQVANL